MLPASAQTAAPAEGSRPTAATDQAGGGWRRAWVIATVVFVASHLAYLAINALNWRAGHMPAPSARLLLSAWSKWDTGHYLRIAQFGYGKVELDSAFFPLYPLLIRAVGLVLPGGYLVAALLVSNAACLGALVLLHRLAAYELGDEVADRSVYYLVAFPTAFFLSAAYNHSLFLLLSVGALYAMRRGNWWLAGLLGALASATRSEGVLLVLPFAYEYLRQRDFRLRRIRWDAAAAAVVPLGLAAFSLYSWYRLGDAFAFSHAQTFWYRSLSWPGDAIWRTGREIGRWPLLAEFSVVNAMDLAAALGFLALLVLCLVGPVKLRRDQLYLVIFGAAVVLMPMMFPAADQRPLISMTRHVLDVVPAFMILGVMGRNRFFDRIYPMPAIALQSLLLLIFMHYDWAG